MNQSEANKDFMPSPNEFKSAKPLSPMLSKYALLISFDFE